MLIALQSGLLLGLLSMMSTPVDKATADVWVTFPGVRSVDLGGGIPDYWQSRVMEQPGVERVETSIMGFGLWTLRSNGARPKTLTEVCMVIGTDLDRTSIALLEPLRRQPHLTAMLAEPMTVLIDESDKGKLGVHTVGETADILGNSVRVIGFVKGLKSLGGAYVFCSTQTARTALHQWADHKTYILAKCKSKAAAAKVVERLQVYPQMTAYTKDEFSFRSRMHWMTTTKAGLALAFTACQQIGTQVRLPWFVVLPAAGLTMAMALGSGLLALRSLQKIDPVHNIR
jgi:putative ABC transport system permease protein